MDRLSALATTVTTHEQELGEWRWSEERRLKASLNLFLLLIFMNTGLAGEQQQYQRWPMGKKWSEMWMAEAAVPQGEDDRCR
jgi:hypothetical protein